MIIVENRRAPSNIERVTTPLFWDRSWHLLEVVHAQ